MNLELKFRNALENKFHEANFEKLEKNEIVQKIKASNKLNYATPVLKTVVEPYPICKVWPETLFQKVKKL